MLSIFLVFQLQGQPKPYEETYRLMIEPIVQNQYGSDYQVGVEVIDSILGKNNSENGEEITDPFGTLQGCILFSAVRYNTDQDSGFFGVFKNGQILWTSDHIIKGVWNKTYSISDINSDGDVDILTTWFTNGDPRVLLMWIFSWDGTNGRIINDLDINSLQTTIRGTSFEIFETNNDIMKIRSVFSSEWSDTSETYEWNGTKFTYAANQLSVRTFLPANQLNVTSKADVGISNSLFVYNYTWFNDSSSRQRIQRFYLEGIRSICSPIKPEKWLFGAWPDTPVVGWNSLVYWDEMIKPGNNRSGFGLSCIGLPTIVSYYVQGNRPIARATENEPEITTEEYRSNIFINSVHGFTIGPKDPPSTFDGLNFIDTLNSYTTQSRTLGWIKYQLTANKYTGLFDSAKSQLQRDAIRATRATLDTVLANANRDSSSTLSSEAYALIYFNTEYLLNQLPIPPPQYKLNLNTIGNGTVTMSPEYTLYDSATTVTLTANPSTGYRFVSWSGDAVGIANPISVLMNSEKTITATFVKE